MKLDWLVPVLFGATEKVTVPLPDPEELALELSVIQGALLVALHGQVAGAATVIYPLPPPA
jgi:hypothetical protein